MKIKDIKVVLSLFDGMSVGQLSLKELGKEFDGKNTIYFSSEVKKTAIKNTKINFPNTIHIGDINKVSFKDGYLNTEKGNYYVGKIDLLLAGSPCQDFSSLNPNSKGLKGEKSKLFFEFYRILKECNPTYFLLENVIMKKEYEEFINNLLNIKPIKINSELVSFQKRPRLYWTNIPNVKIPKDRNISFQDYKEKNYDECLKRKVPFTKSRIAMWGDGKKGNCPNVTNRDKINCLTTNQDRWNNSGLVEFEDFCRYLTIRELELAQTVPIGFTNNLNYRQASNLLGDGWTNEVIKHILKHIDIE